MSSEKLISDELDNSIEPEKEWCRLRVGPDVSAPVKRFMFSTLPSKLWYTAFIPSEYKTIHYMRKYDGWMVILYKDRSGKTRYQTMGSYMHTFLDKLMEQFIDEVGRHLQVDNALKLEITCRDMNTGQELLHDLGSKKPGEVQYVAVVTDFFDGYNKELDAAIVEHIGTTKPTNPVNRYQKVKAQDWRLLWVKHCKLDIKQRLDKLNELLQFVNRIKQYETIQLEIADAFQYSGEKNIVHHLALEIKSKRFEGYVLHCVGKEF